MLRRILMLALVFGFCTACDDHPAAPESATEASPTTVDKWGRSGPGHLTVLTRNIYIGATVENVLTVPAEQIPCAVYDEFQAIAASNYAERAELIADEILATNPHLVGLQEVTLVRSQSPGDFFWPPDLQSPATTVEYDFLQLILDALAARGLQYHVAAKTEDYDIEVPMTTGACDPFPPSLEFNDARLTEYEVILARSDVTTSNPQSGNYAVNLSSEFPMPAPLPPLKVVVRRGWASVDVKVKGIDYRFLSTHLEPSDLTDLFQLAQVDELLGTVVTDPALPTVMVGDFNTAADGSTTATYGHILNAGFVDVWDIANQRDTGHTCCFGSDLVNPDRELDRRFDLVFYRDEVTSTGRAFRGGADATRIGHDLSIRTPSGLLASDHAGVAAEIRRANGEGSF